MDWGQLPNPVMATAITLGHYNGEKGSGSSSNALMLTWIILIRLGDGEGRAGGRGTTQSMQVGNKFLVKIANQLRAISP